MLLYLKVNIRLTFTCKPPICSSHAFVGLISELARRHIPIRLFVLWWLSFVPGPPPLWLESFFWGLPITGRRMRDHWQIRGTGWKVRVRLVTEDRVTERETEKKRSKNEITPDFLFFITMSTVVLNWGSGERVCWHTFSHWERDRLVCICSGSMPHWVSACRWKWLFVIINPGNGRDVCPHSLRHAWLWSSNTTEDNTARSEPRSLLPLLNSLFFLRFYSEWGFVHIAFFIILLPLCYILNKCIKIQWLFYCPDLLIQK